MLLQFNDKRKFYDFDLTIPPERLTIDDGISAKLVEPIHVKGRATRERKDKVQLEFKLTGILEYPCSRCLDPVQTKINYSYDEELEDVGDELDLDEYINECLYINEPSQILCKEDCLGLCPECGVNLNRETCSCHLEEEIDPRLEVLRQLL